jgi:hypothetical protein
LFISRPTPSGNNFLAAQYFSHPLCQFLSWHDTLICMVKFSFFYSELWENKWNQFTTWFIGLIPLFFHPFLLALCSVYSWQLQCIIEQDDINIRSQL